MMRAGFGRGAAALLLLMSAACGGNDDPGTAGSTLRSALGTEGTVTLALGDTVNVSDGVRDFYEARDYQPAWLDDGQLGERGEAVARALVSAEADGLPADRYHIPMVRTNLERIILADTTDRELNVPGTPALTEWPAMGTTARVLLAGADPGAMAAVLGLVARLAA